MITVRAVNAVPLLKSFFWQCTQLKAWTTLQDVCFNLPWDGISLAARLVATFLGAI